MKADFHTHSVASPDGSLTVDDYRKMLASGQLDYIAVTDHNSVETAILIRKKLGDHIIVGEEVMTTEGEIIGLYLRKKIPPHLSSVDTARLIHEQGGLVYIPHPFETVRKGLPVQALNSIADEVDIVEVHNGRAVFQNMSKQAAAWAASHHIPGASASDAHGMHGWGRTYTQLTAAPSREELVSLLGHGTYRHRWPGVEGILYPKLNRLRKRTRDA